MEVIHIITLSGSLCGRDRAWVSVAITRGLEASGSAHGDASGGYGALGKFLRGFDKRHSHAGNEVQVDVAVVEPDAWVVSDKADDAVSVCRDDVAVAFGGYGGEG